MIWLPLTSLVVSARILDLSRARMVEAQIYNLLHNETPKNFDPEAHVLTKHWLKQKEACLAYGNALALYIWLNRALPQTYLDPWPYKEYNPQNYNPPPYAMRESCQKAQRKMLWRLKGEWYGQFWDRHGNVVDQLKQYTVEGLNDEYDRHRRDKHASDSAQAGN